MSSCIVKEKKNCKIKMILIEFISILLLILFIKFFCLFCEIPKGKIEED